MYVCVSRAFLCIGQKEVCVWTCHLRHFLRQGCLLSTANTDTFQILNAWGNFSFNLSVFKNKKCFFLQKKSPFSLPTRFPPSITLSLFYQSWKYLSWIPLVSCNSPSSCFTVSGCQQSVWFMSQVLEEWGLPRGAPGPGQGGGEQEGPERRSLESVGAK